MDWDEICQEAREKFSGYCRVCEDCEGSACSGEVPGMGGIGSGEAFRDNISALREIRMNLRTIHGAKDPDLRTELFGERLSAPILPAPITGISYNMGGAVTEQAFADSIIKGGLMFGTLGMTGDGADPTMYESGIMAIKNGSGKGIPVVKPRLKEEVRKYIAKAEEIGAAAVGMDIDGAGLVTMALKGQPVGPKTVEELKDIVDGCRLPFVLKGVMTPDEAEKAAEAGVSAIVVSNHGGRILDFTPGAARVLPEIASAVKGEIEILADGGVRSGIDVLRYLALGADAVLIGRPLAAAVYGAGAKGVELYLNRIKNELYRAMILTGCQDIGDIDIKVINKQK